MSGVPAGIPYNGNYASLPAATMTPPVEGNRQVTMGPIFWAKLGAGPSTSINFNARSRQVTPLTQIAALVIDNTRCSQTVIAFFPDTMQRIVVEGTSQGIFPVVTNGLEFDLYLATNPVAGDITLVNVLNYLPPPVMLGIVSGGVNMGVTEVDTGTGLTGGPITATGTISLVSPVAIANGGTGGVAANQALDNLAQTGGTNTGNLGRNAAGQWILNPLSSSGSPALPVSVLNGGTGSTTGFTALDTLSSAGAQTGVLTRQSGGTYVFAAAGVGTITGVTPGAGLSGGGTTGNVTLALATPVTVANGGTGAATFTANDFLVGAGTSAIVASANLSQDANGNVIDAHSLGIGGTAVPANAVGDNVLGGGYLVLASQLTTMLSQNVYDGGSNYRLLGAGVGNALIVESSGFAFQSAPSGAAGGVATLANIAGIDTAGDFSTNGYISPALGIVGVTNGSNAAAGRVGEYITSVVTSANIGGSNNSWVLLTSISLTAGDWDVSGQVNFAGTGGAQQLSGCIATASPPTNVLADNASEATWYAGTSTSPAITLSLAPCRQSLSATTTIYLSFFVGNMAGQVFANGKLAARRVR